MRMTKKQMYLMASKQFPALRAGGFSVTALWAEGFSVADLEILEDQIPLVEKPYTKILEGIKSRQRIHKKSTWGPDSPTPEANICQTPMCTAGHLVNLGGAEGWALKKKYEWRVTASLIHYKAHPNLPPQNFDSIPQDWALAYIEHMAEVEAQS